MTLSLASYLVLAVTAWFAGIIRSFSGFGSGLLMAPIFSLILAPTDVLVVILLLDLITTLQLLKGALRDVRWGLVIRLLLPSLLGIPLGLSIIRELDPYYLRKIVALMVIFVSIVMLRGWYYSGRRGFFQDTATGVISGAMTAIAGIGGPPIILYLLSDRELALRTFRAVCIVFFFLAEVATLVPLAVGHALMYSQGMNALALLPVYVMANWAGLSLHRWSLGRYQKQARHWSLLALLGVSVLALAI